MDDLRWPVYAPRNIILDAVADPGPHGGLRLRGTDGKIYLDAVGGIGCCPIGHAHPRWVAAIARQLEQLVSVANIFYTGPQQALATALAHKFPVQDGRVFLCNSGTEATEAALKLALRATQRAEIVAFHGAFHGRTLGAIALTANPAYRDPYVTCLGEDHERFMSARVHRLPYADVEALRAIFAERGDRIAGVFLEPIQGESGIHPAPREFLLEARRLTREYGALLGADEIQSGFGRSGRWSAWNTIVGDAPEDQPDVLWLAKALGGGFPIGACLARREFSDHMTKGSHGSTFGGNPLACAAALETIAIVEDEGLLRSAGAQLGILREIAAARPYPRVKELRGLGAMIGIEVEGDATPLGTALGERGVLATICVGTTVRLLLPYRAGAAELQEIWGRLGEVLA
jgi:acetylornithine/succinyldiaminopimelate/putrescine aminotransferase